MDEKFLYLNKEVVKQCLTPTVVIRTVKKLWSQWNDGKLFEGEHTFLPAGSHAGNEFLHIPAYLDAQNILGFKWINCYMNPAEGYPFSHGNMILLNDIRTASLKAIVSADDITAMRTAGGHGVAAARILGKKKIRNLAVIGNGSEAYCGILGFLSEFPEICNIQIYCRSREKYESLLSRVNQAVTEPYMADKHVKYQKNIEDIGRDADVILVATSSPEILLKWEYIEKGTTVIGIDGFIDIDPKCSELADKWYIVNPETDIKEIIKSGQMSHGYPLKEEKIYGAVPDVIAGKIKGRESEDEIIIYTHMGAGLYDIACAYETYLKAVEKGIGIELHV